MQNVRRFHGGVRGSEMPRGSNLFDGRFGRIFRALPAASFSEDALTALGAAMVAPPDDPPTPETKTDSEENQGINAGYTYLGQFLDHDLTFDPASSLIKQNDPQALTDFRSPRFDLDNVYGRGPDDQPYLYEDDGIHMQLGKQMTGNPADPGTRDLPRHASLNGGPARALIGDPRNDENVIVSQLQATMLRFHNRIVDTHAPASLAEIQRLVRWHYQYVVLNDFLPTIVGLEMVQSILPHLKSGKSILEDKPILHFYKFRSQPFIPVEFSVAAYRFGHSMVRPLYRLNSTVPRVAVFDPQGDDQSLTGFREFPANFAVDWRLFFDMGNAAPPQGPQRIQKSYKIDTSLVHPLGDLPPAIATNPSSLAGRNLLRGLKMGLPSGQDVARAMGMKPLRDDQLMIGKATEEDPPVHKSIVHLPTFGGEFKGKAPLWYYVLAEAQQQFKVNSTPIHLGPVGGRIVAETFIGILLGDSHSFLSQNPTWNPGTPDFKMADLIKMAIGT